MSAEIAGSTPVHRPAPTDAVIHDLLAGRWSPRAFDPGRPVSRAQVLRLLEAARWAPSSNNAQPWRYLVFDDTVPDALEQARSCLRRGNAWARRAPVLLLSLVDRYWPDSTDVNPTAQYDAGASALSLCLQAAADGLVTHQMAGFYPDRARELFAIPERMGTVAFIAVGFAGGLDLLDDRQRQRETAPRRRRPVGESALVGGFTGAPVD